MCSTGGLRNIPIENIPGIEETGYRVPVRATRGGHQLEESQDTDILASLLKEVLDSVKQRKDSWPFREPVNKNEVTDYYERIKYPMGKYFSSPNSFYILRGVCFRFTYDVGTA